MLKSDQLSNLFFNNGLVIYGTDGKNFFDLDYDLIVQLFEKHGIILFRDFNINQKNIKKVTDLFTRSYSNDAQRRRFRFGDPNIRNVDYGFDKIDLHSEASFSPSWPEIIWFFCNKAPLNGGETIFCDGIELWNRLPSKIKGLFLSEQIHYKLNIPVMQKKKYASKEYKNWLIQTLGAGIGTVDKQDGCLKITQKRYAVIESRIPGMFAFANHLLIKLNSEPQILERTFSNKREIPKKVYKKIIFESHKITHSHKWKGSDLLMIDNKRFLHGRKGLAKSDIRDVVILQTKFSNFGYGISTRNS